MRRVELRLTDAGIQVRGPRGALSLSQAFGAELHGFYALPYSVLAVERYVARAREAGFRVELAPDLVAWMEARRELHARIREASQAEAEGGYYAHQVAFARRVRIMPFQYDASETGTGKTVSALAALQAVRARRPLIVCPNIAKLQWVESLETWTDLRPLPLEGGREERLARLARFAERPGTALIVNWEALWPYREALRALPCDAIVADEFHYARNRRAKRTRVLTGLGMPGLSAPVKIALSGTPYEKAAADLYPFFHWIYPQRFRSYWRFAAWFSHLRRLPWAEATEVQGVRNADILADMAYPYMRRLRLADLRDLPEAVWKFVPLEPDPEHARIYRRVARRLRGENPLRALTVLRYLAMDPRLVPENEIPYSGTPVKVRALREWIAELPHCIVFGVLLENLRRVTVEPFFWLDQETKAAERERILKAFRSAGRLYMTVQLGSTGLDFPDCSHVVFAELPWSYTQFAQATGRIRRLTSQRAVYLVPYVVGTIEERILQVLREKRELSLTALQALIAHHLEALEDSRKV